MSEPAKPDSRVGPQRPRLDVLSGLRGVAALWVLFFHARWTWADVFQDPAIADIPFIRQGFLGVDLFFLLSGFVLSYAYEGKLVHYTAREHTQFLAVRLARIWPLHLFTMVVLIGIVVWLPGFTERYANPGTFSAKNWVVAAVLLQNFAPRPMIWNAPAWSVSAEWAAYLVFPFLLSLMRRVKGPLLALAGAFVCLAAVIVVFEAKGLHLDTFGKGGFMRLAGEFTAGCLLYRAYLCGADRLLPPRLADIAFLVSLVVLESGRWLPAVLLVYGAMFVSLVCQGSLLRRLLSWRPVEFLGEISYSVYAMHWMTFQCANWWLAQYGRPVGAMAWLVAVMLVVAPLVIAVGTWKWVEKPAREWGRQVAKRMTRPKVIATSAAA